MIHEEITCPYCRIQFGGYKINNDKVIHLDIGWSYESGLQIQCTQSDYVKTQVLNIDKNENPEFKPGFQAKLNELEEKFLNDPSDISNKNFELDDYFIAFKECLRYGELGEDDEFDDSITTEKVQELYEKGVDLKEAILSFKIQSK